MIRRLIKAHNWLIKTHNWRIKFSNKGPNVGCRWNRSFFEKSKGLATVKTLIIQVERPKFTTTILQQ
jgi:hypothetical protein